MITISNKQRRFPLAVARLQEVAKQLLNLTGYDDFDLGVLFTNNKGIQRYNKQYRNKDKPTDVLSFPYHPNLQAGKRIKPTSDDEKNLGDIIISPEFVWQQLADYPDWETKTKAEQAHAIEERIVVLLIHGFCHLLGYDHETEQQYATMRRKELCFHRHLSH